MKKLLTTVAPLLVVLVLLTGCLGPSPVVEKQTLAPPSAPGQPYQVEAVVTNQGSGDGQIRVTASMKDKKTGVTLARGDQTVDLRDHERLNVVIPLDPPSSAGNLDPKDLEVEVTADYPVQ